MTFNIADPNTQALLYFLAIGLVAGWLAGMLLGGGGLIRNLIVGVIGAFIGGHIVKILNIPLGLPNPTLNALAAATIGAIVVVIAAKLMR